MIKEMKALVYEGPSTMNIRHLPVPEPEEDEVLIRVELAGICGSELSGFLGQNSLRQPPLIMGHEFSGRIAAVGKKVQTFKEGDLVTSNPLVTCGHCRECLTGVAHLCPERSLVSAHRPGAFAQYVTVPAKNTYKLPEGMSADMGAFVEPFACAVHICRLADLAATDRLLIIGAGPIGLLVLKAAQIYGVEQIVIKDLDEGRLEIARDLGGIAVATDQELEAYLQEGFDLAVDAVGLEVTRKQCVESVRARGRVVFSGLHSADSKLPINLAIRQEINMIGAFAYAPYDFEIALQWLGQGKVDLLPWTQYSPLEDGSACFEKLLKNPGKVAKILLTID